MDSAITLKQQVEGINLLLEQIYTPQTKISTILLDCGLTDSDIENIRKNHLQEIVDLALTIFQAFLFARRGGERLWDILCDRYGLLGAEPMTLEKIAKEYDLSRERIRQLESQAIKKLSIHQRKTKLCDILHKEALALIDTDDNLSETRQSIDKRHGQRETYPRAYESWTDEEDRFLAVQHQMGKTVEQLSGLFQRQPGAICARLKKLGLITG
ncbi:MAG TPA: sigma factor-like helix-turn-helix DNA-binding protein [Anaerolineaceae bacterium]|nr:sigma factor-like helix-turn-helix DNA-binding protein [Anaerolineaceae bacterium]